MPTIGNHDEANADVHNTAGSCPIRGRLRRRTVHCDTCIGYGVEITPSLGTLRSRAIVVATYQELGPSPVHVFMNWLGIVVFHQACASQTECVNEYT